MTTNPSPQPKPTISNNGLITICGVVLLLLAMIFVNNDLRYRIDAESDGVHTELKTDTYAATTELKAGIYALRTELKSAISAFRTELKADIDSVRTELKADIENVRLELSADIQRVDDRIFAIVSPTAEPEEVETP